MAHIALREDLPGIQGLMVFRPETAEPLNQLADIRGIRIRANNSCVTTSATPKVLQVSDKMKAYLPLPAKCSAAERK